MPCGSRASRRAVVVPWTAMIPASSNHGGCRIGGNCGWSCSRCCSTPPAPASLIVNPRSAIYSPAAVVEQFRRSRRHHRRSFTIAGEIDRIAPVTKPPG
jgi:hypothetical protein